MSSIDEDQLIIDAVQSHYSENDTPYFLAELGVLFRSEEIAIPAGVRFKDYLKSRFHGQLVVVQDAENPARIAIAPLGKEEAVLKQLSTRILDAAPESPIDHSRLPLALVAAFCKIPPLGSQVYFRTTQPFRYETRPQAPSGDYIEIDDQYRPASLAGRSVYQLSHSDKQMIYESIEEWAAENAINLRDLYFDPFSRSAKHETAHVAGKENALQRLIDAQDPELRRRIKIPGDIASTLMGLP